MNVHYYFLVAMVVIRFVFRLSKSKKNFYKDFYCEKKSHLSRMPSLGRRMSTFGNLITRGKIASQCPGRSCYYSGKWPLLTKHECCECYFSFSITHQTAAGSKPKDFSFPNFPIGLSNGSLSRWLPQLRRLWT